MTEYELDTLPKQLRTKSSMVYLGERIAFGSECELMDIAANEIEFLKEKCDRYRKALEEIAKEDYRGNKPWSKTLAEKALKEMTI